jgi:hypothetical protein
MLILQALLIEKCTHACCHCSRRLSSPSVHTNKIQTASSNNKEIHKEKDETIQITVTGYMTYKG